MPVNPRKTWAAASDVANVMVVSRSSAERARLGGLFGDAGFTVLESADIPAAQRMIRAARLDLIVLGCPSLVGDELAFCRTVASGPRIPLLVLADDADVVDQILALELGADDLLIGPVAERLVLARARALLRRTRPHTGAPIAPEGADQWRLNLTTRAAISPSGRSVLLSPGDASALHLFLANPDVVFTCEAGARALGARRPDARAFRTTVCRLRKKLDSLDVRGPIQTVRGVGYVYAPSDRRHPDDSPPPAQGARGGAGDAELRPVSLAA
jgi:two-component system OmpR family response regulator